MEASSVLADRWDFLDGAHVMHELLLLFRGVDGLIRHLILLVQVVRVVA